MRVSVANQDEVRDVTEPTPPLHQPLVSMGIRKSSQRGKVCVRRIPVFSELRKHYSWTLIHRAFRLACHLPTAVAMVVTIATDRVSRYPLPWTYINFELDPEFPGRWLVHRWRNARPSTFLNCISSILVMPHLRSFKLHVRFRHLMEPSATSGTKRFNTIETQSLVRHKEICRCISTSFSSFERRCRRF